MNYFINFSGHCEIEANSREEAYAKFWLMVSENKPLSESYYKIDDIEEDDDEPADIDDDCGFDPFVGSYTWDC